MQWISKEVYDDKTSRTNAITSYSPIKDRISYYPSSCDGRNYGNFNAGSDAVVTHQIEAYRKGWLVNVYGDGELHETFATAYADPDDKNLPHPDMVISNGTDEIVRTIQQFTKEKNTQGVDVITHPSAPYRKLVYLVNLGATLALNKITVDILDKRIEAELKLGERNCK